MPAIIGPIMTGPISTQLPTHAGTSPRREEVVLVVGTRRGTYPT